MEGKENRLELASNLIKELESSLNRQIADFEKDHPEIKLAILVTDKREIELKALVFISQ